MQTARTRALIIALACLILLSCDHDTSVPPMEATGLIAFMGDSITANWPVQRYLVPILNTGVSGEEIPQMEARFANDVLSADPTAVVILGGFNDINRWGAVDPSYIFAMVQMAQAANAKVIVGTLLPAYGTVLNDEKIDDELIDAFNEVLVQGAASHGYEIADFHSALLLDKQPDTSLFVDGVHPNSAGYDRMWVTLRSVLDDNHLLLERPN